MRRIAVVGSGIIGLIAAYGLRRKGFAVTLYSDRTPEQWLRESRPTGTAARFELALSYERELGLNHWDGVAPKGEGVFLTFCPKKHQQLIRLQGRDEQPFQAVDMRLQCHRWLSDFDGSVVFESVTPDRLEAITAQHDLTLIAAGKSDLCNLFERDAERSVYTTPQRNLTMVIATGRMSVDSCPFLPVKFEFLGTDGEIFFVPYLHKDAGPSWNIVIEAKPGSRIDRFAGITNGEEALAMAKKVVDELFPWSSAWLREMKLADPLGWLSGRIAPTVRKPVATLPSGRIVAALGDTQIAFDPIAAQGANTGVKQARHLVDAIARRGDAPYDAAFLTRTFDTFWDEHARWACLFNNMFLEPIPAPAKELLIAQTRSQPIADAFFANFNDPRRYTNAFLNMPAARSLITEKTGRPWLLAAIAGRARVLGGLVRSLPLGTTTGAPPGGAAAGGSAGWPSQTAR